MFFGIGTIASIIGIDKYTFFGKKVLTGSDEDRLGISRREMEPMEDFHMKTSLFEGERTGSEIQAMFGIIYVDYIDDIEHFPDIFYIAQNFDGIDGDEVLSGDDVLCNSCYSFQINKDVSLYYKYVNMLSSGIKLKHTFFVDFEKDPDGYVSKVFIFYDSDNPDKNVDYGTDFGTMDEITEEIFDEYAIKH